jgi:hypothetical protein
MSQRSLQFNPELSSSLNVTNEPFRGLLFCDFSYVDGIFGLRFQLASTQTLESRVYVRYELVATGYEVNGSYDFEQRQGRMEVHSLINGENPIGIQFFLVPANQIFFQELGEPDPESVELRIYMGEDELLLRFPVVLPTTESSFTSVPLS